MDLVPVPAGAVDRVRPHLDESAADPDVGDDLAGDGACRDARGGLPRRGAAAAAVVADAVFDVVGEIGMSGPVPVLDLGIVLRALVDILDQERDRRACRDLFAAALVDEDAGQDLDLVGLAPLGREPRLAGPAPVEVGLDIARRERDQRRTAVDDAAERRPMALAEGSDAEEMAERVVGHADAEPRRAL